MLDKSPTTMSSAKLVKTVDGLRQSVNREPRPSEEPVTKTRAILKSFG